jgi:signal transduction histidine kinase
VAHEIRNPLGTVRTAVFAIGDAIKRDQTFVSLGRTMERVERARQLAERNILRCDRIITELLDYARERALDLKPTAIDPWLEALLDEQDIPAEIVCTRDLNAGVEIPVDGEHLRRAVINVVNNAVDALQDDNAVSNQLTVRTHVGQGRLEMRFSDTGCGIPGYVMDRVFEPLFSTKTFGIGLGMPIVRKIMQQHGGEVEIESPSTMLRTSKTGQPGPETVKGGTTVILWLPLAGASK